MSTSLSVRIMISEAHSRVVGHTRGVVWILFHGVPVLSIGAVVQ